MWINRDDAFEAVRATLKLLEVGAVAMGGDDRYVFPGAFFLRGCELVNAAGMCDVKRNMVFRSQGRTLTDNGEIEHRDMYRLNANGREFAEHLKRLDDRAAKPKQEGAK